MEQANWKSGSADALLAEFFAQDDLKAVSYTHLDVYKRQGQESGRFEGLALIRV